MLQWWCGIVESHLPSTSNRLCFFHSRGFNVRDTYRQPPASPPALRGGTYFRSGQEELPAESSHQSPSFLLRPIETPPRRLHSLWNREVNVPRNEPRSTTGEASEEKNASESRGVNGVSRRVFAEENRKRWNGVAAREEWSIHKTEINRKRTKGRGIEGEKCVTRRWSRRLSVEWEEGKG